VIFRPQAENRPAIVCLYQRLHAIVGFRCSVSLKHIVGHVTSLMRAGLMASIARSHHSFISQSLSFDS
jgi:hypothetical protein